MTEKRDDTSEYFTGIVHGMIGLLLFVAGCIAIATWPWSGQ